MLTALQPPRGRGIFDRGIQSNLSPASPECLAGAFPQCRNHRAFGVIAASESRGREGRAACAKRRAGRRGHFSRPYRGPFLCGEPSSLPRSILDQSACVLPVSGRVLPENVPRCFESLASLAPCRVSHTGREWRFTLSGLSFNPWFDFPSGGRAVFSVSAGGNHGRKCVPEALRNHRAHCLFASCAAAVRRSHSMTAPESSQTMYSMISRFFRSAHRPWRVP